MAAVGTFVVVMPDVMADPYTWEAALLGLCALGLVGLIAGAIAAFGAIDPAETGSGLFLALGGLLVGALAASWAYSADRSSVGALVLLAGSVPLAFGYLIGFALVGSAESALDRA